MSLSRRTPHRNDLPRNASVTMGKIALPETILCEYLQAMKKGVLSLNGANCASCAYAIEHVGRKIKGVDEIRVQAGEKRVYVDYSGDEAVLDKIAAIVKNIGYEAKVVESGVA